MWVISDNSALSALAEMGLMEVLPRILGRVTIPASVASESQHPGAPKALRDWIARPPSWLTVEPDPADLLEETHVLGAGEAAAITLAWNHRGTSYLILDEKRGRAVAKTLGLPVTGLLAILVEAAITGELEFDDALSRLLATGFRLSPALIEDARTRVKNAKEQQDTTA
jgi:predicted nucleic acid-binding protein